MSFVISNKTRAALFAGCISSAAAFAVSSYSWAEGPAQTSGGNFGKSETGLDAVDVEECWTAWFKVEVCVTLSA